MPFVSHRGARIHFEVCGRGPTVVLQHGLFSCGARWAQYGYVEALAARFRVVTVDALGHGASDKPHAAARYARAERAGDLCAVLDALGAERMHLVGYSMGGWMATGVAIHHPERLASLTLGGWDPVRGAAGGGARTPPFELVLAAVRSRIPDLVAWVTPADEPALAACWQALAELEGAVDALAALRCPLLYWSGRDDACHAALEALAAAHGAAFLATDGDHAAALVSETPRVVARLTALFGGGEPLP